MKFHRFLSDFFFNELKIPSKHIRQTQKVFHRFLYRIEIPIEVYRKFTIQNEYNI